jgi:hypothetical protein
MIPMGSAGPILPSQGVSKMSDIVYKFLTFENAFRVMEQHELKVSLLSELNDIYDCQPVVGPASLEPGYLSREAASDFIGAVPDTSGVLCFSRSYRSPLLWGHYAEQAKGIALGFRFNQQGLQDQFDVDYRSSRPVLKWPEGTPLGHSEIGHLMKELFGVKALEWKYEEEVRYVIDLGTCVPRNRMYFAPFFTRELREVLIGPRSSASAVYIRHFLAKHYRGLQVSLFTTHMHPERFEIESRPFPPNQPFVS